MVFVKTKICSCVLTIYWFLVSFIPANQPLRSCRHIFSVKRVCFWRSLPRYDASPSPRVVQEHPWLHASPKFCKLITNLLGIISQQTFINNTVKTKTQIMQSIL